MRTANTAERLSISELWILMVENGGQLPHEVDVTQRELGELAKKWNEYVEEEVREADWDQSLGNMDLSYDLAV